MRISTFYIFYQHIRRVLASSLHSCSKSPNRVVAGYLTEFQQHVVARIAAPSPEHSGDGNTDKQLPGTKFHNSGTFRIARFHSLFSLLQHQQRISVVKSAGSVPWHAPSGLSAS